MTANSDRLKNDKLQHHVELPDLHVLHLFHVFLNATENWAFNLIHHLPNVQTTIASKRFIPCNFYSSDFEFIEFPFKKIDNPKRLLGLKMANGLTGFFQRFYPGYIASNIDKCDLMHSHFAVVGWEYMKLAKRLNIPHIVSFYGADYEHYPYLQPVWHKRYQQLFKSADLFLCEGTHGARILKKIGCPPEKIQVARLGVEVQHIAFQNRVKNSGELNLLQIATMTEKKGHIHSVKAFVLALKNAPNMTLTLVGKDKNSLKPTLEKIIKTEKCEDRVFFLDQIDFNHLHDFMKNYHVFIHPSQFTDEKDCEGGAPIVLLDAQATGMPVISTTHCDIPDEIIHHQTGLLSPEKDTSDLSVSIQKFYHMDQTEFDSYAKNGRTHVEQHYDIASNAKRLRDIYDEVLADRIS